MTTDFLNGRRFRGIFFLCISLAFALINGNKFFFWDTISQISIPANWYYDNNFRQFFVPDESATGHPTFVAMYLAAVWKLFGRTLFVSHLALFPFIFGILFQLFRYIKRSNERHIFIWLTFALVALDPTLVSQLSLITFDVIQIFLFLWCINSILDKKKIQLSIAFAAICMTSLRGMICGAGIVIFAFLFDYIENKKFSLKPLINFLPGIGLSLIFFGTFYFSKHWIIHNTVSNKWIEFSQFASPVEILRNVGIFGWRLIDYGRLGLWIAFAIILFKLIKFKSVKDTFLRNTLLIALTQFLVFFPVCIIYRNPFGHRYLLPIMIPVAIFTSIWILKYTRSKFLIISLFAAVLFSGWFWVYPDKIAQGWDGTPAHWPYYRLKNEMVKFLESENIPVCNVGSFFPNTDSFRLTDLSNKESSFKDDEDLSCEYIIFSNVFNQKDNVIDELFLSVNWVEIKSISRRNVRMILFKRKSQKPESCPLPPKGGSLNIR
jgi:hypothetical protein